MYHLAFNQEELNSDIHTPLYLLIQEFVHGALMNEIEKYLGPSVRYIEPEDVMIQSYDETIAPGFDSDGLMNLLPESVNKWLLDSHIDPVVFTAKKLCQLVRIIKAPKEEDPDIIHRYLISSMGYLSESKEAMPFANKNLLIDGFIDYYDSDRTTYPYVGREDFGKLTRKAFSGLHGLVLAEDEWDSCILFENDDYEMLNTEEGPVAGLANLYLGFNEYSRPYFEFLFTSVGENAPIDLMLQLDMIAEYAMRALRLSIRQEMLVREIYGEETEDTTDPGTMS